MASNHGPKGRRGPGLAPGEKLQKGIVKRVVKDIFSFFPVRLPIVLTCILLSALISAMPSIFQQKVIAVIETAYKSGNWTGVKGDIFGYVRILVLLYSIALICNVIFTQMMPPSRRELSKK